MKAAVLSVISLLGFFQIGISQNWSLYHSHENEIGHFAVSWYDEEYVVADEEGIRIYRDGSVTLIADQRYVLGDIYEVALNSNNLHSLVYQDEVLYVATLDGHLLAYDEAELINGVPIKVYDAGINDNGDYTAILDFQDKRWFADLSIEVDRILLDAYGDDKGEIIYNTDVHTMTCRQIAACASENEVIVISREEVINQFSFDDLPFDAIRDIEMVNLVLYPGVGRFANFWMTTDHGLAFYSANSNRSSEIANWVEGDIASFTKENSWLRSNDLLGLELINAERAPFPLSETMVTWANDPIPTLYHFNVRGDESCIYDASNSIIDDTHPIRGISKDENENVYVIQGDQVLKLELARELDCMITGTKDLSDNTLSVSPNPATSYFSINRNAENLQIFNCTGAQIKSWNATQNGYSIEDLTQGIYVVRAMVDGRQMRSMLVIN